MKMRHASLDAEGKINKSQNSGQYANLNPKITGGDNGTGNRVSTGIKEGNSGKEFAGR